MYFRKIKIHLSNIYLTLISWYNVQKFVTSWLQLHYLYTVLKTKISKPSNGVSGGTFSSSSSNILRTFTEGVGSVETSVEISLEGVGSLTVDEFLLVLEVDAFFPVFEIYCKKSNLLFILDTSLIQNKVNTLC